MTLWLDREHACVSSGHNDAGSSLLTINDLIFNEDYNIDPTNLMTTNRKNEWRLKDDSDKSIIAKRNAFRNKNLDAFMDEKNLPTASFCYSSQL